MLFQVIFRNFYEIRPIHVIEPYANLCSCFNVTDGYATLGPPTATCPKCHAIMWKE